MSQLSKTKLRISRRKLRTRSKIVKTGSTSRLRVSAFRSTNHIYAQVIDDIAQKTIASFSTLMLDEVVGTKSEQAKKVGLEVAKLAKAAGIKQVTFDRGPFLYHGRIKELAQGLREGGLEF